MTPRIAVIAIWAPDVDAAARFYAENLGLTLLPHHDLPHFRLENAILAVLPGRPARPKEDRPSHFPLFAIEVDSLDAYLPHLADAGAAPLFGVEDNPQARFIRFSDPAGNLVELVEFKR